MCQFKFRMLIGVHDIGRAWTVEELRWKDWVDLHKLWWVCVKEKNIMFTQELERKRLDPGYGDFEAKARKKEVGPQCAVRKR